MPPPPACREPSPSWPGCFRSVSWPGPPCDGRMSWSRSFDGSPPEIAMFAMDHAATALLVKRRFPSVAMTPLLVSVQAMELAWVGLNYLGIERTTTEATVRSVADIHLAYMPYSHSVGSAVGAAVLA